MYRIELTPGTRAWNTIRAGAPATDAGLVPLQAGNILDDAVEVVRLVALDDIGGRKVALLDLHTWHEVVGVNHFQDGGIEAEFDCRPYRFSRPAARNSTATVFDTTTLLTAGET